MPYEIDCLVIGAGVVGLAIARELTRRGRDVYLVDKERSFGMVTSSRNSEVIHAGIYYRPGSLKAKLCVRGRDLLYRYCLERSIPHKNIQKLIVASSECDTEKLAALKANAEANDVSDLQWLDREDVRLMEPSIMATTALLSPSTGIIDSHAYMEALLHDFEGAGGTFVRNTVVIGGTAVKDGVEIRLGDDERSILIAGTVVNSAGLSAPDVARSIEGVQEDSIPRPHYAVGHYFSLAGRSPFSRLIYPLPAAGGLGVHVTLDMSGAARFGPDVSWRESIDYSFDADRKPSFVSAIQQYYPSLDPDALRPAFTGIRPKISGPEDPNKDFVIQSADEHGVDGLVNLFGIESPGLTASLALAQDVADLTHGY